MAGGASNDEKVRGQGSSNPPPTRTNDATRMDFNIALLRFRRTRMAAIKGPKIQSCFRTPTPNEVRKRHKLTTSQSTVLQRNAISATRRKNRLGTTQGAKLR